MGEEGIVIFPLADPSTVSAEDSVEASRPRKLKNYF
jgi:hypothetical protein